MKILLAQPRGFCAGVARAVDIVLAAVAKFGAPVYVRKEIVHNRAVLRALAAKGAVFVDEVECVPKGATVILSAHGVAPEIHARAAALSLNVVDATCPLVRKVHLEAARFARQNRPTIIVGHHEHEEVVGTLGHAIQGTLVVADVLEAERVVIAPGPEPAVLTQTTYSQIDAVEVVAALRRKFPNLVTPPHDDICYATQNRQTAVREMAKFADVILVLGSANSSNSNRLRDVAQAAGARAYLLDDPAELRLDWLDGSECVGVTSGASTPDHVVEELIDYLCSLKNASIEIVEVAREDVVFGIPSGLAEYARGPAEISPRWPEGKKLSVA
jgi:4-hydroxy-3-methylbut-2-en-1-yl diphosphate reductase